MRIVVVYHKMLLQLWHSKHTFICSVGVRPTLIDLSLFSKLLEKLTNSIWMKNYFLWVSIRIFPPNGAFSVSRDSFQSFVFTVPGSRLWNFPPVPPPVSDMLTLILPTQYRHLTDTTVYSRVSTVLCVDQWLFPLLSTRQNDNKAYPHHWLSTFGAPSPNY